MPKTSSTCTRPATSTAPDSLDQTAAREPHDSEELSAPQPEEVDPSTESNSEPAVNADLNAVDSLPADAQPSKVDEYGAAVASRTNPGASLPPVAAQDAIDDEIGMLSLAGYPNNPLRAARLCITAAADELGLEPAEVLRGAASEVANALQALLDARNKEPDRFPVQRLHVEWQRVARKHTLRALFRHRP